mmetsp:Transcript_35693/g.89156  ORF Transcript_35693/g.89156 Transcript_35693/m.89156 type:complete len:210 (+) Transcript_35693:1885-2514(+)
MPLACNAASADAIPRATRVLHLASGRSSTTPAALSWLVRVPPDIKGNTRKARGGRGCCPGSHAKPITSRMLLCLTRVSAVSSVRSWSARGVRSPLTSLMATSVSWKAAMCLTRKRPRYTTLLLPWSALASLASIEKPFVAFERASKLKFCIVSLPALGQVKARMGEAERCPTLCRTLQLLSASCCRPVGVRLSLSVWKWINSLDHRQRR